ncbi:MAG TPA: PilZ domain-containing protein [Pyrinomonadaceae bacterium]|nr:PilZ domain-containing protein [Acidobacteriota bacterium]HQZ96554.1 PilZ domain-containing protein [Pyrinomonadaceae bacterium]
MLTATPEQTRSITPVAPKPTVVKENRRIQRISLPLPVRVESKIDAETSWNEITRLSDVSAFGAGFVLKRPLKRGRLAVLTLPMPRQLRSFDFTEPQYRIWAVVRRCISVGRTIDKPEYSVGVGFIGKTPPDSYLHNPAQLFDIFHREDNGQGFWHVGPADLLADDSSLPTDIRKQTRFHIPESLKIDRVDALGNILESETTVTENISLGGAAVFTSMKADAGTFLRVSSDRFNVTILSVVRASRVGQDGITRLHLEFIDRLFPLEGIS